MLVAVFFRRLDLFLNLGCLTNSVTQIVELCSSDLTRTDNVNLFYVRRMDGEGLFYTAAVRNTSNSECLGDPAAVLSYNGTLEHLNSLASSLLDLVVNTNGITNVDHRNLCLELLVCKSLKHIHFSVLLKIPGIHAEPRSGLPFYYRLPISRHIRMILYHIKKHFAIVF